MSRCTLILKPREIAYLQEYALYYPVCQGVVAISYKVIFTDEEVMVIV